MKSPSFYVYHEHKQIYFYKTTTSYEKISSGVTLVMTISYSQSYLVEVDKWYISFNFLRET